jgi:uncharacterized protein with FMN-binding domain
MLRHGKKREGLVARLLLSIALVAVSLAYGWWQRHNAAGQTTVESPRAEPPAARKFASARRSSAMTARKEPTAPATQAAGDIAVTASPRRDSGQGAAERLAAPHAGMPSAAAEPAAPSRQDVSSPAPPPAAPLSALATLRMYQPPPPQPPLSLVTGTPAPGAAPPIPPGTHLQDGDYLSDVQQFEWGDLQVKISVHGGQITGVQVVQYPDHRSESLQLSQMASPILDSEVIKTQRSKVDIVSSATDTSYAYRDAIASAIIKATRW